MIIFSHFCAKLIFTVNANNEIKELGNVLMLIITDLCLKKQLNLSVFVSAGPANGQNRCRRSLCS